jgi:hypothetical protein
MAKRMKQRQSVTHLPPDSGMQGELSDDERPHPIAVHANRLIEVRQKLDTQAQELATLAARICPGICQKDPSRAIEIAKALRAEARREISKSGGGKELWKVMCEITADQGRKEAQARGEQFDERFHEGLASVYDMDLVDDLPRKLVEYLDPIYKKYRSFESGVKYITG